MNKKCSKCKATKSVANFYKCVSEKDGLNGWCKSCHYTLMKAYNRTAAGKFAIKKYWKSEKGKKARSRFAKTEKGVTYRKVYLQTEKGKVAKSRTNANRRTRERMVVNNLTLHQWEQTLLLQNNCCTLCGVSFDLVKATKDHIVPVTKGGGLTANNVQALCGPCNSSKGNR